MALQLWHASTDPTYAYYATETRVYQLAAGVLLAMLTRLVTIPARVGWPLAVVGVAGTVAVASSLIEVSPATRGLLATATSLAAIAGLYAAPTGPAARVLALSVPRYLGQISYGTYLWHWPVILVTRQLFEVRDLVVLAVAAPVATGLAALSYEVFERPIRRAPALDRFRWPVVGAGLAASVLAAVLVVPPVLQASVRPVVGNPEGADLSALAEQAAWVEEPVPDGLDLVAALDDVPDAGDPCTTADLDVCVREGGAGARVLLVGDSQAAMFVTAFESLARERGFTFLTNIVRGCGWQAGLVPRCADELTTFYRDVLPALDVDVVVAVSLSRGEPVWQERLADPSRPVGETLSQLHVRTAQETADLVHAAGAPAGGCQGAARHQRLPAQRARPPGLPGPRRPPRRLRRRDAAGEAVHRRGLRGDGRRIAGRHRGRGPEPGAVPRRTHLPTGRRPDRGLEGPGPRHRYVPRRAARGPLGAPDRHRVLVTVSARA